MKESDKELLKATGAVVADQAASSVASLKLDQAALAIAGFGVAWGLTKALLGNALKLRQKRALEWVELVRDNPEVFTEEMMATETFQDGFVYCTEQYIAERNEEKRQYIKRIFLGYATAGDQEEFPLERITTTLHQLSNIDIATLKDVDSARQDINYQVYGGTDKNVDNVYNLIHLGVLREHNGSRIHDGYPAPFVQITAFGNEFLEYVKS